MDLELKEKIALVTGASRGIGRAIARGLAAEGARVALCARDKATLETAAAEIARETRAEPFIVAGDLSRLEEVERAAREVHRRFGRIDILVNNAGAIRGGDFLTIPDAQWADDWSLKLLGYIRVARAVFPLMRAQGGGRIINVVGAAARNPTTGYLPGGVANAGLVNFTKGPGRPRRAPWDPRHRGLAGRDGDGPLAAADGPASRRGRKTARAAPRRGRGGVSARADRAPRGHCGPGLLPRVSACVVPHRDLHHGRRRGDTWRLPLMPGLP